MATKKQVREIKALMSELGERLAEVSEDTKDELLEDSAELMETMKERLAERLELAKERGRQALEKGKAAARQADQYVHENPWQVAAGAAAIGLLVGYLMASKHRD